MRIIAVMSPKGGIGKTTTSDAIAYMLGEEQEKRVLILDGDPQGDTSKTFEALKTGNDVQHCERSRISEAQNAMSELTCRPEAT